MPSKIRDLNILHLFIVFIESPFFTIKTNPENEDISTLLRVTRDSQLNPLLRFRIGTVSERFTECYNLDRSITYVVRAEFQL